MLRKSLLAIGLAAAALSANADTLLIDGVEQATMNSSERPARGQSMTTVEARFGQPSSRVAAIGEPPITRWEYPGFTVFFEYDHVIHAVARH